MTKADENTVYAEARDVDGVENCNFYHSIDLPELGEISAAWDLRGCIDDYLGGLDFAGKRAIDIGTASGFLSFAMERKGAEVVSFDMASGANWDVVPYPSFTKSYDHFLARSIERNTRLQNSYWLSHRLLGSANKVYYGNIYEKLPEELGTFDVAVFGMIFTHLRDPFGALAAILPSVTERVVVTNHFLQGERPVAAFVPSVSEPVQQAFWLPSFGCIRNMLGVLGFEVEDTVAFEPICHVEGYDTSGCAAVVAKRVEF